MLETEARSRKLSALDALLGARFGAQGWGTAGYPEFGLQHPDPDRVQAWADEWFTADNAVLGITGSPDPSLTVVLKSGKRMPRPPVYPLEQKLPAWIHEGYPGVGLSFLAPRTVRFGALMRYLQRHALGRLRFTDSLSYDVSSGALGLNNDVAHGILLADGLPENFSKVWAGLLSVLDQFMIGGATFEEIREDVDGMRKSMQEPAFPVVELDRAITNELYGVAQQDAEGVINELESAAPAVYAGLLADIFSTALAIVPANVAVLDPRFTAIPVWSTEEAAGRSHHLRRPQSPSADSVNLLVVGDSAVTLRQGPGRFVTIRYADVVVLLTWDEGSRTLHSRDGFRIHFCPADWTDGEEVTKTLDAHIAQGLTVPMGPRPNPDPDALTSPQDRVAAAAHPSKPSRKASRQVYVYLGLIILLFLVGRIVLSLVGR